MNIATINGARLGYWESGRTPIGAMRRRISMKKFAFLLLFTAAVSSAQMPASRKAKSDAAKIASALQAGPKFVTQNATVIDYPTSPGGEFRLLRAGTNEWTCLTGFPDGPHDEPGCFDKVFLQFIKDSMARRTPNVQTLGISYMYGGKWVPNKSHTMGSGNEFHVGPHIMIIGLDQKTMQTLNQDGSNGEPYVNHLPGRPELYLVIRTANGRIRKQSPPSAQRDNSEEIHRLFSEIKKSFGKVDVLVNNAGTYEFAPLESITPEHIQKQFNLNVA